jgi:hypothetical protein
MAVVEDEEGMWHSDPVTGNTRSETRQRARDQFKWTVGLEKLVIVLYDCIEVEEIEHEDLAGEIGPAKPARAL